MIATLTLIAMLLMFLGTTRSLTKNRLAEEIADREADAFVAEIRKMKAAAWR